MLKYGKLTLVAVPRHDREEHEEVLHLRGAGARRQERQEEIPRLQLPVDNEGEGRITKTITLCIVIYFLRFDISVVLHSFGSSTLRKCYP